LAKIIKHPKFRTQDVEPSARAVRKWRQRLPLQKIREHKVAILTKKTPSTAKPEKMAFTFSLKETIEKILNNPEIFSRMYFGPGIIAQEKKELWHGDIWKRSPLFGQDFIKIGQGMISLLKIPLEKVKSYEDNMNCIFL
jgi:hypothetical protein